MRTAVADLLPEHVAADEGAQAPELPITLDMPGKFAGFLRTAGLDDAERAALGHGQALRRGTGYTLRVTAVPAVRRQLLDRCQVLDGVGAIPAQRKARREYENRVSTLAPIGP
ncbi:resolvase [Streptomyces sp. NPDC101234]|uniref:resolvase n=1 Tax=Streptomyces sp. NPDC101234 TaxID=3366138 RepID=UPI00382CC443